MNLLIFKPSHSDRKKPILQDWLAKIRFKITVCLWTEGADVNVSFWMEIVTSLYTYLCMQLVSRVGCYTLHVKDTKQYHHKG